MRQVSDLQLIFCATGSKNIPPYKFFLSFFIHFFLNSSFFFEFELNLQINQLT